MKRHRVEIRVRVTGQVAEEAIGELGGERGPAGPTKGPEATSERVERQFIHVLTLMTLKKERILFRISAGE